MKKIFLLPAGVLLALGFQSCQNNTVDDGSTQHSIDSIVNARLVALRDSMMMECNNMVASAAQAHADSLMALSTGKKSTGKTKPTTTTTVTTVTVDPKTGKMQGNDNTQEKKDKLEGNKQSTADKKKEKMNPPK